MHGSLTEACCTCMNGACLCSALEGHQVSHLHLVPTGKPKLHQSETDAWLNMVPEGEDEVCQQLPGQKVRRKLLAGSWRQLAWQLRCEEPTWTGCAKQPARLWPAPSQQPTLRCCWTDAVRADPCLQLPEQLL